MEGRVTSDNATACRTDESLMPRLFLCAIGLAAVALVSCSQPMRPLPTASKVDLARYAGKWFEIARLPNSFQREDSRATAEYTLLPDGAVTVRNTELRPDGTTKTIDGRATAVPGSDGARLRVKFGGLAALAPVPDDGNYWIIAVEPDYSLALVGTPDRDFLWILARSPKVPPEKLAGYVARARQLGFPVERLLPKQG